MLFIMLFSRNFSKKNSANGFNKMTENSFSPSAWFEQLFGFRERVADVAKNIKCEEVGDDAFLVSLVNGKRYKAGNFQVRSISSFDMKPRGGGKLHIIHGHGSYSTHFDYIDVLSNQALPENDGATYLAASNFNCLEFVSQDQTALDGVTGYVYDRTQGPFCALAAGPAIVYRNYFVKHDGKVGQLEKEIELLKKTPIHVTHGYPIITNPEFTNNSSNKKFKWDDENNYLVGVHRGCQLTTTRNGNNFALVNQDDRIVHHVYAAAFNFNGTVDKCNLTIKISKYMLKAEYKAAILAAWENSLLYPNRKGSNKLYLTLLGGGVFGNDIDLIADAIGSNINIIKDSGLDVYVVCFSDSLFTEVNHVLGKHVKSTKGSIIDA